MPVTQAVTLLWTTRRKTMIKATIHLTKKTKINKEKFNTCVVMSRIPSIPAALMGS